jgi:hypothetical protein
MNKNRLNSTDCKKMEETLVLYHYGELGGTDIANVEEHIASCEHCRAELDSMRVMLSGIQPVSPQPFAVARSVNRVKSRIRQGRNRGWMARLVPAAITAAIAILAVGIYHNIGPGIVNHDDVAVHTAPVGVSAVTGLDAAAGEDVYESEEEYTMNEDEELLLALLDGPPAQPEGSLVPHEIMGPHPLGHLTEADPPIYALVEFEPLDDMDVIDDLDLLEDYDAIAELQGF